MQKSQIQFKREANMTLEQQKLVAANVDVIDRAISSLKLWKYYDDYYGIAAIQLCEIAMKKNFEDEESFRKYAYVSIIHAILKHIQETAELNQVPDNTLIFEHCNHMNQRMEFYDQDINFGIQIQLILKTLTESERQIVAMRYMGYTYQDIANKHNVSYRAIQSRMKYIKQKFIAGGLA